MSITLRIRQANRVFLWLALKLEILESPLLRDYDPVNEYQLKIVLSFLKVLAIAASQTSE